MRAAADAMTQRMSLTLAQLRAVRRLYPVKVWALWFVGVLVLLCVAEFDPSVLAFVLDPELLAGVVLFAAYLARRAGRMAVLHARRYLASLFS